MATAFRMTQASAATATDDDLVAATREGDDRAFEELYARYRSRVWAYAFGLTRDHGRAEDIAQEVFISALRRLRKTDAAISFRPWIFEIARNACIDDYRRARRAQEVPIERETEGGEVRVLYGTAPPPEVAMENRQRLDTLRGAFRGLSERHHRIIVLREFEGLSYSQIGERLAMSKVVVESTLFRARRRLREEFDDLSSGRRCERISAMITEEAGRSLRTLGLRDRRELSSHLAVCAGCRRHALEVGLDQDALGGLRAKVAAALPLPLVAAWRGAGRRLAIAARGAHHVSVQAGAVAAQGVDGSAAAGRAVAAAAAVVVAGIGGGLAAQSGGGHAAGRARHAAASTPAPAQFSPAATTLVAGRGLGVIGMRPIGQGPLAAGLRGAGAGSAVRVPFAGGGTWRGASGAITADRPGGLLAGASTPIRGGGGPRGLLDLGPVVPGAAGSHSGVTAIVSSMGTAGIVVHPPSGSAGAVTAGVLGTVAGTGSKLTGAVPLTQPSGEGVGGTAGQSASGSAPGPGAASGGPDVGRTVPSVGAVSSAAATAGSTVPGASSTMSTAGATMSGAGATASSAGAGVSSAGAAVSSAGAAGSSAGATVSSAGASAGGLPFQGTSTATGVVGAVANHLR